MTKVAAEQGAVKVGVKFKDLREAVVALNESGLVTPKIKLVGINQATILAEFMAAVDKIPEETKTPKPVTDFYNRVIDLEKAAKEAGSAGTTKAEKTPEKTKAPKAEKAPKAPKAPKEPKEDKGPGVIASILDIIKTKGPILPADILIELGKIFPDRDNDKMKKTVSAQITGKDSSRMEKEKGVVFVRSDKGLSIKK